MKGKFWRKALAAALALLIVSGGVPIQPLSQVFEDIAITASAEGTTVDLSTLADNYTAQDGDVLTGSTSGTVTIANNAKITLSDVTITGGIVCAGTAEITLVGTNSVSGATNTAGIQIGGSDTTLTINGDGSLTANGAEYAAGIGLNGAWNVTEDVIGGNIVINGGNITANGGVGAAGIGAGFTKGQNNSSERKAIVGNITIKGGTVTAVGVTAVGGHGADGIGAGDNIYYATYQIGTVTIYDDIDKVDASSIKNSESIVYMHDEEDVTATASTYFTIAEDGNRRIIQKKDDTDYNVTIAEEITGGTLTADKTTAKAGELVTLTVTPESGYRLQSLTVKDASNRDVSVSNSKFFMPKGGVTVSATFIQTTAAFDEVTGTLTLTGNVNVSDVQEYKDSATSVICDKNAVLPANCSGLFQNFQSVVKIDLSSANTSAITNTSYMFADCSKLEKIYVNDAWSMANVNRSEGMFQGCELLHGLSSESYYRTIKHSGGDAGSGTYAVIDGKDGQQGYLRLGLWGGTDAETAVPLVNYASDLKGWYKVTEDLTFDHNINLIGDVNLILCDGKTMKVTTDNSDNYDNVLIVSTDDMGDTGTALHNLIIHGGMDQSGKIVCASSSDFRVCGFVYCNVTINGGCVQAEEYADCSVNIGDGKKYYYMDGDTKVMLEGTLSNDQRHAIYNKELIPLVYGVSTPHGVVSDKGKAFEGEVVRLTLDDNDDVSILSVTDGTNALTLNDAGNGTYSFTMPGKDVYVKKAIIADIADQTYTGSAITPEITVTDGEKALTLGTDYEVTYSDNTNVGTAKVTVTFKGDYASLGYVERTFTILPSSVVVNVTGNGTVTYNDKSAASGETIGVTAEKGTDVTLTLTPENGYAVRSVEYGYTNSNGRTMNGAKLPINGTTATLTVPNDLKDGTYVNLTVTFASALAGGADEASAVALTDNTVTDLAGGWYKVDSDITFDHTLNLLGDTHLIIDDSKTMTVNTASNRGIYSDYTLFVSGDGALSVTTTADYGIAVVVRNYVQTDATVTASGYIGIRCMDDFIAFNFDNDFTFSGGQLTATGSGGDGIWADNTITLGWTNPADRITASSYDARGTVKVADGEALTDVSGHFYNGTLSADDLTAISGKALQPVATMDNIPDQTYTGSAITPEPTVIAGSLSLTKGTDYTYSYTNNTNVGTAKVTVTFKGNYASLGSVEKEFNIVRATPTVTAPTARNQTYYSGNVQLIGAGSATNGMMFYSLGTEAAPGDTWGTDATEITANASGTYYVWYKVTGDANYADIEQKCVTVTLSKYVAPTTYKSNQTWTLTMDSYAYDGTAHEPTINGTTRGTVTYTYYNTDTNEELDEAPSAMGNYKVKVYASGNYSYSSRSLTKNYSITDPIDKNGKVSVDAFKANDTVPISDGKIFAGWFTDETCTTAYTEDTGKAYAKFIDEKILTVKAQISSGTTANSEKTSIRFITSVDTLKYQNVGFKITCNGKTIDRKMTKVYTAINAGGAKVKPTVFSKDSKYMEAYTLNNITKDDYGKAFTVTPYYTTQDGTIVDGIPNTFTIANMIK